MKKIFSVLLLQVITLIFPCWVMAVPEITVIPEIHYTAEGGFFRANIKLPIESFSEGIYVIPQVIEGDVFMVPALSQLVLPNNPDIKDGKMFKGSRDGHVTITGRYNKPGKSKIDILYKQILFPQATFQQLVTVTLVFPENGKENPAVLNNWAEQYQSYLSSYGGNDSFQMYWNSVIAPRFGLQATQYNSRRNTGVRPDPYSIFSGYAAIQESLQLEPLEGGTANIQNVSEEMPLTSLSGPSVKSHPFKEMLREKNPALPKLSFAIPFDQYAVFFKDFNKEIELSDLMNEWGGNLLQQVEVSSRNYYVKEKIVDQLCLEETFISRAFGDRVIDEVAFTGNDPFVKEGTAFTVLFYLKDKDTFLNQIQKRYTQAVREKGAQRSEYVISGQKIIAVTSADRRVSSYMVQSGNIAIVSNSMVASERIIETLTGKYISLAASEDFRYMRTIFPQDSQDEDIFVYFSDPHIRNLIGPRWKIGETRRLRCSANMLLISNARTWYLSEKKMEPTMGDLISGGYLGNNIPTCPEHGKYDLDKKTHEVVCSLHNRIGLLTPVGENPLTNVTKAEAGQYKSFVDNYNRYWTKFFDPIGIRIKMGDTVKIQTCILPLIENSWYDGLAKLAGGKRGTVTETNVLPRTVFSLRGDIDLKSFREHSQINELLEIMPINQYFGNEISINICDGQMLFTPSRGLTGMFMAEAGRSDSESLFLGFLASALNLPTYLTIKVKDPKKVEQNLPTIFRNLQHRSILPLPLSAKIIDSLNDTQIYHVTLDVAGMIKFHLYSAVIGDRLVIASRHDIIKDLISGKAMKSIQNEGNFELSIYRNAFHELEQIINLGYQDDLQQACNNNIPLISVLMRDINSDQESSGKNILALRGYEPYCPSGGKYIREKQTDNVICTLHGNKLNPKQPAAGDEKSPTYQMVNNLDKINARLSFTKEGLMTEVEIKRKPKQSWFEKLFE